MRDFINLIENPLLESWAPEYVYHGSRVPVEKFEYREGSRFVLFSEFKVKANGFYFALSPEDAKGYGDNVGVYRINVSKPLIHASDIRNDNQRMADLRYILQPLFAPSVDGDYFIHDGMIHVTEFTKEEFNDPNSDWPLSFVSHSSYGNQHGLEWEVLDNPHVVQRMRERGYDSTTVFEPEHKDHRYSWFVLSPDQIEYVGQYEEDDEDYDDYDDDDLREGLDMRSLINLISKRG